MTRAEIEQYIDNNVLLGNIVTENSRVYKFCENSMSNPALLGSVYIEGFYIKKDNRNKIHLAYYDGDYEELNLGDCIDIIDSEGFINNHNVRCISGKSVIKIGDSSFYSSYVERVDFPNLITIGESAFYNSSITDVVFNKVKKIPLHAFMGSQLRSFKGDEVEVVGEGGFQYCEYLKRLILPKVKKIHLGYCENTYEEGKWIADLQISKDCRFNYKSVY